MDKVNNAQNSNLILDERLASLGKDLSISEKGVLKWAGNFEDFRYLIEGLQLPMAKWTSPGRDCKLYECSDIAIRWYSTKGTITLKGEKSREVEEKLGRIIEKAKETNFSSKSTLLEDSVDGENLHSDTPMGRKITPSSESTSFKRTIECFIESITTKVEALTSDFHKLKTEKFDQLTTEINGLKSKDTCYCSMLLAQDLKRENEQLKAENKDLQGRNNNLAYIVSDLNTRIKDLENEKKSLVTALKLLQVDYNLAYNTIHHNEEKQVSWTEIRSKNKEANEKRAITNTNRFAVLTVEDTDDKGESDHDPVDERRIHRHPNVKAKRPGKSNRPTTPSSQHHDDSISLNGHQSKSPKHRPKVTIVRDSMLKLINPSILRTNLKVVWYSQHCKKSIFWNCEI